MASAVSSVFVPDLVYGSSVMERLRNVVQACDPAIFLETPSNHGHCGQRSDFQGKERD